MLFQLGVSSAVQFENTDVLVIKQSLQQTAVCNLSVMCVLRHFALFCPNRDRLSRSSEFLTVRE